MFCEVNNDRVHWRKRTLENREVPHHRVFKVYGLQLKVEEGISTLITDEIPTTATRC